ncbi:hypothetical protein VIBHAR_05405 [Vibrio campbellii ATCC BAA-1116]|uniref:Uncharacterized protein n=1 Tax=Vibrio campbellii (strain ATCC BAA-1116) TaxID=2902295 RepID=A7N3U9_VIBC1|nr:hypothetical protein VIBHAR_05405 [Vibrio campbellii ATCC BAA-1116]
MSLKYNEINKNVKCMYHKLNKKECIWVLIIKIREPIGDLFY